MISRGMPLPVSETRTATYLPGGGAGNHARECGVERPRWLGADAQEAAVWHGVARVDAEVHEHLVELRGIAIEAAGDPAAMSHLDPDVPRKGLRDDIGDLAEQIGSGWRFTRSPSTPRAKVSTCFTKPAARWAEFSIVFTSPLAVLRQADVQQARGP